MPKVTIILTSFNHNKYLRSAIDSVLAQTFSDFELYIWDDASTDDSWEIIESYKDPRIIKFRNEETRRGAYGINKCISEYASGIYIAIHHSDDVWKPDKLQQQVEYLDKNHSCGAVFTDIQLIDEFDEDLSGKNHPFNSIFETSNHGRHEWLRIFFYEGNGLCHPSVLVRKSCYDKVGVYDRRLGLLPDLDQWIRVCFYYDIHILQEKLIYFRVFRDSSNASGIRKDTAIRADTELTVVLNRYRMIETVDEFRKIFTHLPDSYCIDGANIDYLLARTALETGRHAYRIFGINLLFELMGNPETVEQLENLHNFTYKDLVRLSGETDKETAWLQLELQRVKSTVSWRITKPVRFCAFLFRKIFLLK